MYKHILVPTDGSPLSLKAAKEASALAKTMKAKITTVYVSPLFYPTINSETMRPRHMQVLQEAHRKTTEAAAALALGKVEATAAASKVPCDKVHASDDRPWDAIIKAAKGRKCDLIVMASHGRRGIAGVLIGSETTKVLTHSKMPVLVCR